MNPFIKKILQKFYFKKSITSLMLVVFVFSFLYINDVFAAIGVPIILHHQGRLLDSSGNLLGGSSGTNYCFRFSLYDATSSGTKLWPSGTPSKMTVNVKNGILNADIGDTLAGGDLLNFDFNTTDEIYLNIDVANSSGGSCASVSSFETLSPRQRVVSAGYAINSKTVGGFTPSQTPTGSQIPVLSGGALSLAGSVSAGGLSLTLGSDATGDIFYRNSGGNFARLAVGTTGQALVVSGGGLPSWATLPGGGDALTANPLSQFAATTSLQLKNTISDETGSGALVFADSPVFTTPNIGSATGSISGNAGTVTNGVYTTGAGTVYLAPNGSGSALTGITATQVGAPSGSGTSSGTNTGDNSANSSSQPVDSDLTTLAGLTATTGNILQSVGSAWASQTPTQVTATLINFVGDSGAGGTKGLVPAPGVGDATKFLKGDGTWTSVTTGGGGDALVANPLSQFAATTSLQLKNTISDETGSGALVFADSPTLVTPALGTPSALVLTNATGLPAASVLAGTFGTGAYTMDTSLTVPTIIGGTGTTSDLNLKTTSGIGATGADMHFLVGNNGATEAMTILNDGSVGIGTAAPGSTLHIVQPVSTSGSPTGLTLVGGAHTTLTASTEASDVNFNLARTVQFATGAIANQRAIQITAPTYSFAGASTITRASTVAIVGAPIAGTNATITNRHMLSLIATSDTDVTSGLYIRAGTTGGGLGTALKIDDPSGTPLFEVQYNQVSFANGKTTIGNNGNLNVGSNTGASAGIINVSGGYADIRTVGTTTANTYLRLATYGTASGGHIALMPGALGGAGNVGINTVSPTGTLDISQIVAATGVLKGIVYTGAVNTNQTLSTEIPSLTLTTAGRQWATGALTTQREVLITQPTYSFVGASTITDAATVGIAGAPIASTNATLTNSHGLLIQAGAVGAGVTNSYGLTVNAQTGATTANYAAAFLGGNVGIGTAAPGDKLEVVGDIVSKGTSWTARTSSAETNNWHAVTYGNGIFVAVSDFGAGQRIMTSPDGINWTARTSSLALEDVVYGNGLFVAVSDGGEVITSPDGITWTSQTPAESNTWRSVTYGNGLFVAVSYSGTNQVMTSPDGITWTARAEAAANQWWNVTYGNGLFVATSLDGANQVMTSPDGITWTSRTAVAANQWRGITYGNGLFVAVSSSSSGVMTSPDGITWTARTAANANGWPAVTYGNGLFVATGTNQVMTSPDGITWTARTTPTNGWADVAYGNGLFVAVTFGGSNRVMTSSRTEYTSLSSNNMYQGGMSIFGNVGIGVTGPTAVLHLKAGTTAASSAPLKFTSGTLNTTAEAGAVEFLTDAYYGTITTGAARKQFAFTSDLSTYLPLAGGTLTGNLLFSLDNTLDIGASGATRPRTGYFGTSVIVPVGTFATSISTPSIITASGALGITPASGSNLNVTLGTTGDFAVNTNQLYVDTSLGNVGVGTATPLKTLDVAGGGRFTGKASSALTGTADPTASTTLVGSSTLFLTELVVGDRITVNAETRTVTAIASDTSLTVDTAFTDTASASITKLPAIFLARDSSNVLKLVLNDLGSLGINTTAPGKKLDVLDASTAQLRLTSSAGAAYAELYADSSGDLRISASGSGGLEHVRINEGNLWVCAGGSCSTLVTTTSPPITNGNIIVENALILDNNFKLKYTGATTADMLDSGDNIILEFDEGT